MTAREKIEQELEATIDGALYAEEPNVKVVTRTDYEQLLRSWLELDAALEKIENNNDSDEDASWARECRAQAHKMIGENQNG